MRGFSHFLLRTALSDGDGFPFHRGEAAVGVRTGARGLTTVKKQPARAEPGLSLPGSGLPNPGRR